MDPKQIEDEDARLGGGVLVGADPIRTFLAEQGMENADPYYLRRAGWPIGKTSTNGGGYLIASRKRLLRHIEKITAPKKIDA